METTEAEAVDEVSSPTVEAIIEESAEDEVPLATADEAPLEPLFEASEASPNGEVDSAEVADAESAVETETPARKPRPRRVASAAKGRTRTARR